MGLSPFPYDPRANPYYQPVPWEVPFTAAAEGIGHGLSGAIGAYNTQDQAKIPYEKTLFETGQPGALTNRIRRMGIPFNPADLEEQAMLQHELTSLGLPEGMEYTEQGAQKISELAGRRAKAPAGVQYFKPKKTAKVSAALRTAQLKPFADYISKREAEVAALTQKANAGNLTGAQLSEVHAKIKQINGAISHARTASAQALGLLTTEDPTEFYLATPVVTDLQKNLPQFDTAIGGASPVPRRIPGMRLGYKLAGTTLMWDEVDSTGLKVTHKSLKVSAPDANTIFRAAQAAERQGERFDHEVFMEGLRQTNRVDLMEKRIRRYEDSAVRQKDKALVFATQQTRLWVQTQLEGLDKYNPAKRAQQLLAIERRIDAEVQRQVGIYNTLYGTPTAPPPAKEEVPSFGGGTK